ncbi:lytic transglycosylase domain-containing protein [Bradyrhizobium liaoningense]
MPSAVRRARQASSYTGRWWPHVGSGLVLAALVVLSACPVWAQSVPSAASFDARFAAVESPGEARTAPANANPGGQKESGATSGKTDPLALRAPDARASYRALIENEAARAGLPPEIAEAVMAVESNYNAAAIGGVGEIGLMQILPSTARMLGFSGTLSDLAAPATNIHYGVTYLAQAWRLAGGDLCTAAMKYRAGHGETRFSFLSVNYCLAVRAKLAARGYRVTGTVPVATFGERGGGCGRRCLDGRGTGRVDLAALNTRLSAIVMQVRATR